MDGLFREEEFGTRCISINDVLGQYFVNCDGATVVLHEGGGYCRVEDVEVRVGDASEGWKDCIWGVGVSIEYLLLSRFGLCLCLLFLHVLPSEEGNYTDGGGCP